MVAEGAFEERFLALLHIAFNDEVAVGGYHQVLREALHQFHGLAAQESGQHIFVDALGQRCRCGVGIDRVAAQAYGHGQPVRTFGQMLRAGLVPVPVHPRRGIVDHLHPVHSDVADAGNGTDRVHERKGDEAAAVLRPALEHGKRAQFRGVLHHILAGRVALVLPGRPGSGPVQQWQQPELVAQAFLLAQHVLRQRVDPCTDAVERLDVQGIADACLGTHHVGEDGVGRAGVLEQQRLAAARLLRFDVRSTRDLQHRIRELLDPPQFSLFFQELDVFFQAVVHNQVFHMKNASYAKNP